MPSWPGQEKLGLSLSLSFSFLVRFVRTSDKSIHGVVGGMGSTFLKQSGRDCNGLIFMNFFVGTEKNHENIGIVGDLVEVDLNTSLKRYSFSSLLGLK
jgi:hypothetical protein